VTARAGVEDVVVDSAAAVVAVGAEKEDAVKAVEKEDAEKEDVTKEVAAREDAAKEVAVDVVKAAWHVVVAGAARGSSRGRAETRERESIFQ
jgi:hypothetical protein